MTSNRVYISFEYMKIIICELQSEELMKDNHRSYIHNFCSGEKKA